MRVDARFSEAEAAELRAAAARAGLTLTGYVAAAGLAGARQAPPPKVLPARLVATQGLLGVLVGVRLELRRIGSNLNQLTRAANATGVVPEGVHGVLARVDAAVRAIDDRSVDVGAGGGPR